MNNFINYFIKIIINIIIKITNFKIKIKPN